MLSITPVYQEFAAEVIGLTIADAVSPETFAEVRAALDKYAVLVFPDQPVTQDQQLRFAGLFGPLEMSVGATVYNADTPRRLDKPQLSDISNLDENGSLLSKNDMRRLINISNQLWHTDSSFKRVPASVSLLSAQEIAPVGGATEFADMRAAWDALSDEKKKSLEGLIAEHSYFHSRMLTGFDVSNVPDDWKQRQPPVPQTLVRTHPGSKRKSLYLAAHIQRIHDLDDEESRRLVNELMEFATQPQFVYRHRWRTNDVVIWDNRCTMHRGRPFDEKYRRSMRRATVQDTGPTVPDASSDAPHTHQIQG